MKSKTALASRSLRPHRLADPAAASLARHRAQCRICRHRQREEIEREFLDWTSVREIAEQYRLPSYRSLYRHAHALNLFRTRRGHVERVLDGIIERSGEARITAASVISAIRLLIDLQSSGDWVYLKALRMPLPPVPTGSEPRPSCASEPEESEAEDEQEEGRTRKQRARVSGRLTPAPARDDDDDGDREPPRFPEQLFREGHSEPPTSPKIPPAPTAGSSVSASKDSPAPAPAPAAPEPGMRREPDGPPQVAGMAWPWPKDRMPLIRRGRWRGRPRSG